ncbi:unnamed protein product [Notodromas monacha]|uniref:Glycosyltransferase family 92 protein n=1 Tax=Notodromas monacha TaxID=399045 RepID=A0A7R9BIF7_9CRUS|nr:unnamed protein product [Notodromas monacha]CAG0915003.1 unnamed protein product [Notodromas monacha]
MKRAHILSVLIPIWVFVVIFLSNSDHEDLLQHISMLPKTHQIHEINNCTLVFCNAFKALNQSTKNMAAEYWEHILPYNGNSSNGQWQPVLGKSDKSFVFSAFYDGIDNVIKVVAILDQNSSEGLLCAYFDKDLEPIYQYFNKSYTVKAFPSKSQFYAPQDSGFWELVILCPYVSQTVEYVSIFEKTRLGLSPGNLLKVLKPVGLNNQTRSGVSVCSKVMSRNFKDVVQIIEYIELHAVIGVRLFIFYVYSCSKQVACVFKHYADQAMKFFQENQSEVQVLVTDYEFPYTWFESVEFGPYSALADCFFRSQALGMKYTAGLDFDELIIPGEDKALDQVLNSMQQEFPNGGSFLFFYRKHFPLFFPDDQEHPRFHDDEGLMEIPLRPLRKTWMDNFTQLVGKSVGVIERTLFVGVHYVDFFRHTKFHHVWVPWEVGLIHHYRHLPGLSPKQWEDYFLGTMNHTIHLNKSGHEFVRVRTAWRYASRYFFWFILRLKTGVMVVSDDDHRFMRRPNPGACVFNWSRSGGGGAAGAGIGGPQWFSVRVSGGLSDGRHG